MKTCLHFINIIDGPRSKIVRSKSPHSKKERISMFVFGGGFLVTVVVLAIFFPEPKPFQYLVFRVALAMAAAGVTAHLPGSISIEIKQSIRAGSALAVFVIIYFVNPADIFSNSRETQPLKVRNFCVLSASDRAPKESTSLSAKASNTPSSPVDDIDVRFLMRLRVKSIVLITFMREGVRTARKQRKPREKSSVVGTAHFVPR